jgi:hypothetical protein
MVSSLATLLFSVKKKCSEPIKRLRAESRYFLRSTGHSRLAADGNCYAGLAQTVTFDLNNVAVPGQFIWGLALNTTNWGYTPTGVPGPYDSLNVGLNSNPDGVSAYTPSVGSDLVPGSIYWNTLYAPYYTDGGAGGTGTFRIDSNWAPYDPAITFSSSNPTPEPSFLLLVGAGFAGIFIVRYKFRRHAA